jgi:hypothetical protein
MLRRLPGVYALHPALTPGHVFFGAYRSTPPVCQHPVIPEERPSTRLSRLHRCPPRRGRPPCAVSVLLRVSCPISSRMYSGYFFFRAKSVAINRATRPGRPPVAGCCRTGSPVTAERWSRGFFGLRKRSRAIGTSVPAPTGGSSGRDGGRSGSAGIRCRFSDSSS